VTHVPHRQPRSAGRNLQRALWSVVCTACCTAGLPGQEPAPQAEPVTPNVLLIVLDDLNDWIGCLGGHPQARTPHLDALAAESLLFTNAYCAAPACNPSRTALFSGRAPWKTGLIRNQQVFRDLLPDEVLLPRHFADHGYHAAGGGKLLHYIVDARSWDAYFPSLERENPFPRTRQPQERPVSLPREPWMYVEADWGPVDATRDEYGGDVLVAQWAAGELTRPHDEPFFRAAGIYRPHEPWFLPREDFEQFSPEETELPPGYRADDLDDVPEAGQSLARNRYLAHIRAHGLWKSGVAAYLASITFADAMVGQILDALDRGPHRDTTVVVVTSDHGWHLGEKEHWQKFTGWRASARVPLLIRVPRGTPGLPQGSPAGSRCDAAVSLLDVFPTLTELCAVPAKPGVDGRSLVPLLQDPQRRDWPGTVRTQLGQPDAFALSGRRFRYIRYGDGGEELYDIARDPHEWTNLVTAPEHAARVEALRKIAADELSAPGTSRPPSEPGEARSPRR
jgi:arylsulfatase A-like enzyme